MKLATEFQYVVVNKDTLNVDRLGRDTSREQVSENEPRGFMREVKVNV